MGGVIESVSISRPRRWRTGEGSVALAARAGRECLHAAGCDPNELDLLVNTGVYREICEPAMASFIQREIGANPRLAGLGGRHTFSFDLSNSGCGFVSAIQVVDGFLRSGRIERGMVVAGDADPTPGHSVGLGFDPGGAALLLGRGEPGEGFSAFHFESFAKHAHLFGSEGCWVRDDRPRRRLHVGRQPGHALFVREDERHLAEAAASAQQALGRFLRESGLRPADLDLVLPSQFPSGFPGALADASGIDAGRVVDATQEYGTVHTAGIAAALRVAMAQGRFERARRVLFIAVGAGISVALALYTRK